MVYTGSGLPNGPLPVGLKGAGNMGKPMVINIQKFSIHDGEGIRTTVFFKGCPLSCRWCHNPESQCYTREILCHLDRCTGCGACVKACPQKAISLDETHKARTDYDKCTACGLCTDYCVQNARELVGKEYEPAELVKKLEKDIMFYEQSHGGVTLSGGEVMVQDIDYIEEVARRLFDKGIPVDIDTSGHAPYEHFRRILPYVDTFLYDMKLMDPEAHKEYMGVDNRLILENLKKLSADGAKINIRLPLIDGVNATDEHIAQVIGFLKDNDIRTCQVNLLKYHNTGSSKYPKLGREYDGGRMAVPADEWLAQVVETFQQNGFPNIHIGG